MQSYTPIDGERWLPVPGYPGYDVSDLGRIRRKGLSKYTVLDGKLDRVGYRQVGLVRDGIQHWFMVHRLVACVFTEPTKLTASDGQFITVNHKDRVKTNNKLDNLELMSMADNHRHWRKFDLERMASGQC
jgi:hypothetical protein